MHYTSTKFQGLKVSFREALLKGQPSDGGLYMPLHIPKVSKKQLIAFSALSFHEIAYLVISPYTQTDLPHSILKDIIHDAFSFNLPLKKLSTHLHVMELYHGPTLSFKDFGARFLARLLSWMNRNSSTFIDVLVATSGDTGAAIASSFHNLPGIRVTILYPRDRISAFQEQQITRFKENISSIAITGSFDDCQRIVKKALSDPDLKSAYRFTSANSINIGRLIAQIPYYFEARKYFNSPEAVTIVVPSGNFGNITAGLLARQMGMPNTSFIAATNENSPISRYFQTGIFLPTEPILTLANAMDVGNPSNFLRIQHMYCSTWNNITTAFTPHVSTDHQIRSTIAEVRRAYKYDIDPHTACAFNSSQHLTKGLRSSPHILLATAHPNKFPISARSNDPHPGSPNTQKTFQNSPCVILPNNYEDFKQWFFLHSQN